MRTIKAVAFVALLAAAAVIISVMAVAADSSADDTGGVKVEGHGSGIGITISYYPEQPDPGTGKTYATIELAEPPEKDVDVYIGDQYVGPVRSNTTIRVYVVPTLDIGTYPVLIAYHEPPMKEVAQCDLVVSEYYEVTYDPNGGTGSMESSWIISGGSLQLPECDFVAPEGSNFRCWEVGGQEKDPHDSVAITGATVVKALWTVETYTIETISSPVGGGTVTGGGTYASGAKVTLTATPATGYKFVEWNDHNTNAVRTITVTGNATYTATFQQITKYTITVQASPSSGGTVSGGGQYSAGETVTISASASQGYVFLEWNDHNKNPTRQITVTGDATYTARFQTTTTVYEIVVVADPEDGGKVTGGGEYRSGQRARLSATPAEGYVFVEWSDHSTDRTRTITVTGDATYIAKFQGTAGSYTITAVASPKNGGTVTGGGTYDSGTSVTLTAAPAEGFKFVEWDDHTKEASRSIVVNGDKTYTAIFEPLTFTISKSAGGGGTIDGPSKVAYGEDAEFIIEGNKDYIVRDVIVDGESLGKRLVYVFKDVTASHTISALFEYAKGAETYEDEDGNIIEEYEKMIDGVTVEVIDVSSPDGSMRSESQATDMAIGLTVTAEVEKDSEGKVTVSILKAHLDGDAETIDIGKSVIAELESFAEATAQAIGSSKTSVDLLIDVGTEAGTLEKAIANIDCNGTDSIASITLVGDVGMMTFDEVAVRSITTDTDVLSIVIKLSDASDISEDQKEAAQGNTVYDVYVTCDGVRIHEYDGRIQLSLPYEPKLGEDTSKVRIYHIDDDANVQEIGGTYSERYVTVTLPHLSLYFASGDYVEPEKNDQSILLYVVVGIGLVLLLLLLFILYKRRGSDEQAE